MEILFLPISVCHFTFCKSIKQHIIMTTLLTINLIEILLHTIEYFTLIEYLKKEFNKKSTKLVKLTIKIIKPFQK